MLTISLATSSVSASGVRFLGLFFLSFSPDTKWGFDDAGCQTPGAPAASSLPKCKAAAERDSSSTDRHSREREREKGKLCGWPSLVLAISANSRLLLSRQEISHGFAALVSTSSLKFWVWIGPKDRSAEELPRAQPQREGENGVQHTSNIKETEGGRKRANTLNSDAHYGGSQPGER